MNQSGNQDEKARFTHKKKKLRFMNISLKTKLNFFFVLISLIPTILVGVIAYKVSESIVKNKEIEKNIMDLRVVNSFVSNYLDGQKDFGRRLAINKSVLSFMEQGQGGNPDSEQKLAIEMLLSDNFDSNGVKSIFLFNNHGGIIANGKNYSASYDKIVSWYPQLLAGSQCVWGDPASMNGLDIIPLYIDVRDPKTNQNIGIITLNLDERYIFSLYKDFDLENGELLILDENGAIVSCKNKYQLRLSLEEVFNIRGPFQESRGYLERKVVSNDLLVTYYKNATYNWTYLSIQNFKDLIADSEVIKRVTLIACSACLLVSLLLSIFLSMKLTKPLHKLILVMKEVEKGNLDIRANFKSMDEVGRIGNAFDNMVMQLQQSISDIYTAQRKLRDSEMKILQMQINPHFLYNTLSSIIWLANSGKKNEVIETVSALSKFFRISLASGDESISVEEELEQVENYLIIQKIRFKKEFDYRFEIGANVRKLRLLRFILQPLVENSLYHGVIGREFSGLVVVKAFRTAERLILEVWDNGAGMNDEMLERLNAALTQKGGEGGLGIGTSNVNSRIRILYGDDFGLSYRAEDGWTIARVLIPMQIDDIGQKNNDTEGMLCTIS